MRESYLLQADTGGLMARGHFVWVDMGGALGFRDLATEKKVFQKLLDGGVYIVSDPQEADDEWHKSDSVGSGERLSQFHIWMVQGDFQCRS